MELGELARVLPDWYEQNGRALPWRTDRQPYHVWVSEVMLQQTRGAAVMGYYTRFLEALPDIAALAACPEDRLLKLWEGLGYYSRARNLQRAAQKLMAEYGGVFPETYADIRALPGVGDYTAGAVASICFDLPTPAVDGNVLRVVCRWCAERADVLLPATKRSVSAALAAVYPAGRCGIFTQALMELGETVCLPAGTPRCELCPLGGTCRSRAGRLWQEIPKRGAKKARREEAVTVLLLEQDGAWAVRRRSDSGLLAGLWEFPCLDGALDEQAALDAAAQLGCAPRELLRGTRGTHTFTHIQWHMQSYVIRCGTRAQGLVWLTPEALDAQCPLPTAFRRFRPLLDDGQI